MGSAGAFLLRGARTGLSEEAPTISNWPVQSGLHYPLMSPSLNWIKQTKDLAKRSSATNVSRVSPSTRSFGGDHEALAVR
jgi:hypothetical protein